LETVQSGQSVLERVFALGSTARRWTKSNIFPH